MREAPIPLTALERGLLQVSLRQFVHRVFRHKLPKAYWTLYCKLNQPSQAPDSIDDDAVEIL